MIEILIFFEDFYQCSNKVTPYLISEPNKNIESFSSTVKLKAFLKLIDVLIKEKILDYQ